ncbi:MAG: hypothetical protein WBF04_22900 [Candidatus Sulfotelmatobacter sp.]
MRELSDCQFSKWRLLKTNNREILKIIADRNRRIVELAADADLTIQEIADAVHCSKDSRHEYSLRCS